MYQNNLSQNVVCSCYQDPFKAFGTWKKPSTQTISGKQIAQQTEISTVT